MSTRTLATAGLIAAACAGAAAPVAQAKVVNCSSYSDYPNTKISSARNMTCGAAVKVMKSYKGNISRTFKVQAFRCTQQSGAQYGGQWRCTSGAKAFRFEFKD